MRVSVLALALGLVFGLAFAQPAAAHAFLDHAEPRVGSKPAAPPTRIRLWFTQGVEPTLSAVKVEGPPGFGGAGAALPVGGDPRALFVTLRQPVPAGRYVVHWRVVSVDSHMTSGDFNFDVRP